MITFAVSCVEKKAYRTWWTCCGWCTGCAVFRTKSAGVGWNKVANFTYQTERTWCAGEAGQCTSCACSPTRKITVPAWATFDYSCFIITSYAVINAIFAWQARSTATVILLLALQAGACTGANTARGYTPLAGVGACIQVEPINATVAVGSRIAQLASFRACAAWSSTCVGGEVEARSTFQAIGYGCTGKAAVHVGSTGGAQIRWVQIVP